jgi:hypothetical protein
VSAFNACTVPGVLVFAARELHVAPLGGLGDDCLALLDSLRVKQRISVRRTHVVHAHVAIAFMRGSIFAALMTKLPLPQMPIAPMRLRSMMSCVPR